MRALSDRRDHSAQQNPFVGVQFAGERDAAFTCRHDCFCQLVGTSLNEPSANLLPQVHAPTLEEF